MNSKEQLQREQSQEKVDPGELRIYSGEIQNILDNMKSLLEREWRWRSMSSFTGSGPKPPKYEQVFSPAERKKLQSLNTLKLIKRSLDEAKVKLGDDGRVEVWKMGEWKDLENLLVEHEKIING